jgi:hypothetical protein
MSLRLPFRVTDTVSLSLGASPVVQAALWAVVLILMSVGLVAGLFALRKWMVGSGDTSGNSGLTLAELREMARTGVISQEEFERAREAAIRVAQRSGRDRSSEPTLDSGARISQTPLSRTGGMSEEFHGGTGRAPPANRLPERKPRSHPPGGQESGQPDR